MTKSEHLKTFNLRRDLSDTLSKLLMLKENGVQKLTEGGLHDTKSKQLNVCSLAQTAHIREECLPRDNKNRKTFHYEDLVGKLNSIVLGQYLIRGNMSISPADIKEMQDNDQYLRDIRLQLQGDPRKVDSHFVVIRNLLFKQDLVFGEQLHRLCLPPLICENILHILHDCSKAHISRINLINQYNANFYTRGIEGISRKVIQKCLHCSLNMRRRKLMVKGSHRQFEKNTVPGEVWVLVWTCFFSLMLTVVTISCWYSQKG